MQQLIFQVWNTLNIDAPLSSESKWRIKKLFLLLLLLQAKGEEICLINKLDQINNLTKPEEYKIWFHDNFVSQYQAIFENAVAGQMMISLETSTEIIRLIERYQAATSPLQWTNFGAQIYLENYLSQKIDLLYQIGFLAGILAPNETFDSYTRVTDKTQDVCDKVCRWVKDNIEVTIDYLNIYEPFIYMYKKFTWQRSDALKEIGVRSGLLPEEVFEAEDEISEVNAKVVIDWLDENYGVKLITPEKYHSEFVNKFTVNYRQVFTKVALLAVPIISLLPISILVYDHFQKQQSLNPYRALLEKRLEVEKSLPLKPAQ